MYEHSLFWYTSISWEVAKETAADLTAAAIRCQVALTGRGNITYSKELERWDVRKAARAQSGSGDAAGALGWVERLTPQNRLDGLLGIAEGLGAPRP